MVLRECEDCGVESVGGNNFEMRPEFVKKWRLTSKGLKET